MGNVVKLNYDAYRTIWFWQVRHHLEDGWTLVRAHTFRFLITKAVVEEVVVRAVSGQVVEIVEPGVGAVGWLWRWLP